MRNFEHLNFRIMASRRNLKKAVKGISESLLCDCIALSMVEDIDNQTISEITSEVMALEKDYVMRISHTERGSEKLFYRSCATSLQKRQTTLRLA